MNFKGHEGVVLPFNEEHIMPVEFIRFMESPLGWLKVEASRDGLTAVSFTDEKGEEGGGYGWADLACNELKEYFDRKRKSFDVPLDLIGTHFQLLIWEELQKINYAQTLSYELVARRLGDIKIIRAAATANGRNPIAIIVPCHRVIGKDGSLTGYSGGLWRKKWLLEFESRDIQKSLFE